MRMFDYEKYKVECPICKWTLEDDIYYKVENDEIIPIPMRNTSEGLIPANSEDKVYPKVIKTLEGVQEIHFCVKCNKEFKYDLPSKEI
jgi:hypothetical protein